MSGLSAEQTVVAKSGGAFINVKSWFCGLSNCPPIMDNLLVYCDIGLSSTTGSVLVGLPVLRRLHRNRRA